VKPWNIIFQPSINFRNLF